ncbi:MAG: glycosyltransferase family 2 protein [Bacteroidetes bacterium]|nr:glycosyltransferase family 2 protein [Bacteroidota bacterium]
MKKKNEMDVSEKARGIDISIVIPFYRGEKFLPRLVDSIVASFQASSGNLCVELIVIVDSAESDADHVFMLVNQGITGIANLILVVKRNEDNLGVAQSRTVGKHLSTGTYITFIDQDDYVGLSYFSVMERNLPADFDFFLLNGYVEYEQYHNHRPVFYYNPGLSFNKIAKVNFLITPGLLVFNKSRMVCEFRQVSADHPGSVDWACYLELLSHSSFRYRYIPQKILHYVVHAENYHQDKSNFINSQIRTIGYFQNKYPENRSIKIKLASLQFRLKRHLGMIRLSTLTIKDIGGFLSFIYIELFSPHNLILLIWRKWSTLHSHRPV